MLLPLKTPLDAALSAAELAQLERAARKPLGARELIPFVAMRWLALAILSSACVRAPPIWWRRGATDETRRLAEYDCERDARYTGVSGNKWGVGSTRELDKDMFHRCMEAHGWLLLDVEEAARADAARERGPFMPPPVTAAGPEGPYAYDAGVFQPRKVE